MKPSPFGLGVVVGIVGSAVGLVAALTALYSAFRNAPYPGG